MKNNLFSSIIVSVSLLLLFVLVLPAFDKTRALFKAIDERELILNEQKQSLDKVNSLYKSIEKEKENIEKLDNVLPYEKQLPELITALKKISSDSGLALSEIKFSDLNSRGVIKKLNIDLKISGEFNSFINFLKSLEKNMRLLKLYSMNIVTLKTEASENKTIIYNLRLETNFLQN